MSFTRFIVAGIASLVVLAGFGCARDTTIILVRHAEREGQGQDPSLTPAGQQRAQSLVGTVRRAGVSAIYVTPLQRTRQTAAPSAQALNLTPIVTPIGSSPETHAATIAADIMTNHAGACVLVVGHSNTVPLILAELGLPEPPAIAEDEFDRLFILIRRKDSPPRFIEGRYGP